MAREECCAVGSWAEPLVPVGGETGCRSVSVREYLLGRSRYPVVGPVGNLTDPSEDLTCSLYF